MAWLKKIWFFIKYLIGPVLAYLKGRRDEKTAYYVNELKEENKVLKAGFERMQKTISRYDNIRSDVDKLLGSERKIYTSDQLLQRVRKRDDKIGE